MNIVIIYVIFLFFNQQRIETFTNTGDNLCSLYSTQPKELNNKCKTLTETNCKSTSCCIWLNDSSCVAGGKTGPIFHTF